MNDTNTSLMSSISTNNFLRDCIELAIDGFLFRGVTPSDHYYRFSQSFPKAFTLLTSYSNPNVSSIMMTPKQSHHHQISSSSKHSGTQHQRTNNVPPLDLSSLNPNILLEQQPVSTIIPPNNPGMTIQVKKPVYSPKGVSFIIQFLKIDFMRIYFSILFFIHKYAFIECLFLMYINGVQEWKLVLRFNAKSKIFFEHEYN